MTQPDEPDTSRAFGRQVLSAADRWASRPVTGLAVIALVRPEHGSDAELRAAGDTHRQTRQSAAGQDDATEETTGDH
jgi:hypothetical protein